MQLTRWQKSLLALVVFVTSALVSVYVPTSHTNAQFIDRIVRPCATGATPRVQAVASSNGDLAITTCAGRSLTVNGVAVVIAGGAAPTNATYITQTPNATLTAEQALSALATGIMFVTTTTGVVTSLGPDLPFANLTQASAASVLLGRGSAAGGGDFQEITLGAGLTMTGTVLSSSASATPGGADTQVQFNDAGAFGGDAGFTYNKTTDEITLAGALRTGVATDTDLAGDLTIGGGGTVTYTFVKTYATAPHCVANDTDVSPLPIGASATTTTLTITGTAGHVATYICIGRT